jgi:GntR family transcriptional regulator
VSIVSHRRGPVTIGVQYGAATRAPHVRQQIRRLRPSSVENVARRLRDILRSEIFSGAFPGGVLPREAELMLHHDARRAAVRRALAMLRDEGVVERVQGLGTFAVRERYIADMEELHAETSGALNPQVRSRVVDRSFVPAPDFVARKLSLSAGERVLRLEYVALVNREPVGLATNYVAFPEAEAVAETSFLGDWYTLLADAGVRIGGTEWVLSSVNADEIVADYLEVAPGTAVTLGEEMIWDESDRPYDFAVVYLRTDRYAFSSKSWSIGARDGRSRLACTEEVSMLG